MSISDAGLALIKRFEGLRLKAYDDGVGVWTIGYGHTQGVRQGDTITEEQATAYLREDVADATDAVARLVKVGLTQSQRDALISLVFNIGATAFSTSTLLRKLNAGDYQGAADQFPRWNRGGGRVLEGLVKRRAAERALFLSAEPVPDEWDTVPFDTNPIPIDPINAPQGEPMAPLITAILSTALPTLIKAAPELIRAIGDGPQSEKNAKAMEIVAEVVTASTGAPNVQAGIEAIESDPAQAAAFRAGVQERYYELSEVGGGVAAARKAEATFIAAGGKVWDSPSFWVALCLLPLVYMIVGNVVGILGAPLNDEVRSAISNGVVGLILGGLIGYYYGQTTSRNRT